MMNIGMVGNAGNFSEPIATAAVDLIANDKEYQEGLKRAHKSLSLFDEKTQKVAKRAGKAMLAGGVAMTAALSGLVLQAAKAGDELDKMSLRTGVTVENLSRLSYAAKISGTDAMALETSFRFLARRMDETSKGIGIAQEAFEALGVSVMDSSGQLRPSVDVMKDVASAISGLDNTAQQVSAAMDIFGARSGPGLLPLLKQGEVGIQSLMDKAGELGLVISTEAATASAEFTDRLLELQETMKMAAFQMGSNLLPVAQDIVNTFTELITKFNKLDESQQSFITKSALVATGFGLVAGPALLLVGYLPKIIAGFKSLAVVGAAVPYVAIAAGLALLAYKARDLGKYIEPLPGRMEKLFESAPATFERWALGADQAAFAQEKLLEALIASDKTVVGILEHSDITPFAGVADRVDRALTALDEVLKDKILVTDRLYEELVKSLGDDADGYISVTQAAVEITDSLAESTGNLVKPLEDVDKALADVAKALAELKELGKPGELWFLKDLKDIPEQRVTPAIDIDPKQRGGMMAYIQSVLEAVDAHNELGDSIDANRAKLFPGGQDAKYRAIAAAEHEREAEAAMDNVTALNAELERLERERAANRERWDERRARLEKRDQAQLEQAHEERRRFEEKEAKEINAIKDRLAKADVKRTKVTISELEKLWNGYVDSIKDDFRTLFDDMLDPSVKDKWDNFWRSLANSARNYISDILTTRLFQQFSQIGQAAGLAGAYQRITPATIAQGGIPAIPLPMKAPEPEPLGPPTPGLTEAATTAAVIAGANPIVAALAMIPFAQKASGIFTKTPETLSGNVIIDERIKEALLEQAMKQGGMLYPGQGQTIGQAVYAANIGELEKRWLANQPQLRQTGAMPGSTGLGIRVENPLLNMAPAAPTVVNIGSVPVTLPGIKQMTPSEIEDTVTRQLLPAMKSAVKRGLFNRSVLRRG